MARGDDGLRNECRPVWRMADTRPHGRPIVLVVVVLATILLPAIGLLLMEAGALGPDIAEFGYPNGASLAYAAHLLVLLVTWAVIGRLVRGAQPARATPNSVLDLSIYSRSRFQRLSIIVTVLIFAYIIFLLFGAGGWLVVTGRVGRGEFRGSFGSLGPLVYLARDFLVPVATALVAFVYRRCAPRRRETWLLLGCLTVAALAGASWGYKAAAVITLIPALILLFPRASPRQSLLAIPLVGVLLLSTMVFERANAPTALLVLGTRATLGTANTAWKVWDLNKTHVELPPYLPTLTSALGGRVGSALGVVSRNDLARFSSLDFTAMLTNVVQGFAPSVNANTSNVTGTVFSEGLIALGSPGFLLFSALAGIVIGLNGFVVRTGERQARPIMAALAAVFFTSSTFSWLNAGGIVALMNLPFVVSYALAYLAARALLAVSGIRTSPLRIADVA